MEYRHVPVMLDEVLRFLKPKVGGRYIDCTLGGAGYTLAISAAVGKKGLVLGIDQDDIAIEHAQQEIRLRKIDNIILIKNNFKNLAEAVQELVEAGSLARGKFDGIVFDLGLSSAQLDDESRGFSFKGDRPLDMSFGPGVRKRTSDIVNFYQHGELARIFRELGEERRAGKMASAILEARKVKKFKTTADLIQVIETVSPVRPGYRIHPATKIFQALRMETNGELDSLTEVMPKAVDLLLPGGRLVVVSFHSGEDRIVKRFIKNEVTLEAITKRPLVPTDQEASENPRSRSAKLRAAIKIDNFQKE